MPVLGEKKKNAGSLEGPGLTAVKGLESRVRDTEIEAKGVAEKRGKNTLPIWNPVMTGQKAEELG